jgi:hypothetical protein
MLHRTLSATPGVVLPNILKETEGVVTAPITNRFACQLSR